MSCQTTASATTDRNRPAYWDERYQHAETPWDTGIVPPELHEILDTGLLRPPGVTLDLGCGTGTNVNHLASLGFTAIGIDLAWQAVTEAQRKARQTGLPARFLVGDVADLPLAGIQACFALDMGCLHNLSAENRARYAQSLARLMAPGGLYLLYGFDYDPHNQRGSHGFLPDEIARRFAPAFDFVWLRPSLQGERPVAWYLLRRR